MVLLNAGDVIILSLDNPTFLGAGIRFLGRMSPYEILIRNNFDGDYLYCPVDSREIDVYPYRYKVLHMGKQKLVLEFVERYDGKNEEERAQLSMFI